MSQALFSFELNTFSFSTSLQDSKMTAKNLGLHPHISKYRSKDHKVLEFASTDLNESPKIMGPYLNENYSQMPLRHCLQHEFNPKTRMKSTAHRPNKTNMGKNTPLKRKLVIIYQKGDRP